MMECRRLGAVDANVLRGAWISHLPGMLARKRIAGSDMAKISEE